jgi:Family of unknown function (DUF6680)
MEEPSFWSMQFKDVLTLLILVATVFAIVLGPIKAVQITRANDEAREAKRRKHEVFHALMKTRRITLAPEHVMALNLVQVEFYDHPKIDYAYKAYMALLSRKPPEPSDPNADQFFEEQEDALYDLLFEIGAQLGYNYDKRDLKKLAYGPRGWQTDETQLRALRSLMIDTLVGRRAVPVMDFDKTLRGSGRFPPPPEA